MTRLQMNYAMGFVALVCFGCSTGHTNQLTRAEAIAPLYCEQGPDCEAKWHEAIDFIGLHSGFRLKKVTEQIAQTTGPKGTSAFATTLRKQPVEGKLYRIAVEVKCGRNFVEESFCRQDRVMQYVAALKRTVNPTLPPHSAVIGKRSDENLRTIDIGPSPNTNVAPGRAGARQTGRPLTESDLLRLLTGGVYCSRVATLVRERGIAFSPTKRDLELLQHAGADEELQRAILEAQETRRGRDS